MGSLNTDDESLSRIDLADAIVNNGPISYSSKNYLKQENDCLRVPRSSQTPMALMEVSIALHSVTLLCHMSTGHPEPFVLRALLSLC